MHHIEYEGLVCPVVDQDIRKSGKCSKFVKVKGGKVKIPDYWVEAKEEEVEA